MTEKESKVWVIVSEFHRKMDLLDKGYAEASCKVDFHKTFEEIQKEADTWYDTRVEKMVQKLVADLEPIMKGE